MSFISKILAGKQAATNEGGHIGGMEDFMTLIRVYYQAVMATQLGITNLSTLPDLRTFKQTLHVPTQNNKLGIAEKSRCRKMLIELYRIDELFFKEIDGSIKRHCRTMNDVQNYLFRFQGFSQELMMLMGNLMQWKFRIPGLFKKMLYTMIAKSVNDILTKDTWKDEGVRRSVVTIRKYQQSLGYSEKWMTEYVYHIVLLAKKEPKPAQSEAKEKGK